ncbi:zinc finger protein 703, partial [Fukomys damarensis]|uniref:zinc finger protein 703 n=1 Tax=Fukomys damarensis TaxID=885580 RepID=UPI00053FFF22
AEDKSSFKPYSKGSAGGDARKDSGSSSVSSASSSSSSPGDKAGFRVPSAACQPFPPHGAPVSASSSSSSPGGSRGGSPHHPDCKNGGAVGGAEPDKKDPEPKPSPEPGSIVGAYAGYPSQFVPGLDPSKSGLVGSQLSGGLGLPPGKPPSSSPLTGASPPSFLQGLCRDPYCLGGYHGASHLGGSSCRYHPYGKSHLSTAGGLAVPSLPTAGPYYSPYTLYGQRLASASALGYQ